MQILTNSTQAVRASETLWQQQLKQAIRSPEELARRLEIPVERVCPQQASGPFPLFVPEPFLERMERGNPLDPLLLQVLPHRLENGASPKFNADPVNESEYSPVPGVLHKYPGRVLLVVNGTCAVHCRYCFRRHFPYGSGNGLTAGWSEAIDYIRRDTTLTEVILSGGDPLTLVDSRLSRLIQSLESIAHLRTLRIHTRLPIVLPARITGTFCENLERSRLNAVAVVHCNHAQELDEHAASALCRLKRACTSVLNQAVLLRGVNDSVQALTELGIRLFRAGVLPYYLHQLDPVAGAAHFEVPVERGLELIRELRASQPGYLVPRYVQEIPGRPCKTVLA